MLEFEGLQVLRQGVRDLAQQDGVHVVDLVLWDEIFPHRDSYDVLEFVL